MVLQYTVMSNNQAEQDVKMAKVRQKDLRNLPQCAGRRKLLPHPQLYFDSQEARVAGL